MATVAIARMPASVSSSASRKGGKAAGLLHCESSHTAWAAHFGKGVVHTIQQDGRVFSGLAAHQRPMRGLHRAEAHIRIGMFHQFPEQGDRDRIRDFDFPCLLA